METLMSPKLCASAMLLFVAQICHVAQASPTPPVPWSQWTVNVWNTYCELSMDHNAQDARMLTPGYDRAFLRFAATTRKPHIGYPKDKMFKVRFEFLVYGTNYELPPNNHVVSARISEFELSLTRTQHGIHTLTLKRRICPSCVSYSGDPDPFP